jgi:hypothetical protein
MIYRDTLGGIGVKIHESAAPLIDLLQEIGVEIGTAQLNGLARLMGSRTPNLTDDARCLCVGFASPVEALALLAQVHERLSPADFVAVSPVGVAKLSADMHVAVFFGAVGMAAPH